MVLGWISYVITVIATEVVEDINIVKDILSYHIDQH